MQVTRISHLFSAELLCLPVGFASLVVLSLCLRLLLSLFNFRADSAQLCHERFIGAAIHSSGDGVLDEGILFFMAGFLFLLSNVGARGLTQR